MKCLLLIIFLLFKHDHDQNVGKFLHAIRVVETGGWKNDGIGAVGDHGNSIGPYQIQRAYWLDANIAGTWEQCSTDVAYSERVMLAYFKRYAKTALENEDWEKLARIHNGGPKGYRHKATLPYWQKVLDKLR